MFVREREELLIEHSGSDSRIHPGVIAPPAGTLFQFNYKDSNRGSGRRHNGEGTTSAPGGNENIIIGISSRVYRSRRAFPAKV